MWTQFKLKTTVVVMGQASLTTRVPVGYDPSSTDAALVNDIPKGGSRDAVYAGLVRKGQYHSLNKPSTI